MSRRQQRRRAGRRRAHVAVASGGAAAIASLGSGGVAHAAQQFTVSNLNDSGSGSLRAAIASVNADTSDTAAPGDSIVFASGLSGDLNLTSSDKPGDSLYVGRPMQIVGPGANALRIHADPGSRIFEFGEYSGVTMATKIAGLTLTGGNISSGSGGAISSNYDLELDSDVLSNNSAYNGGGAVLDNATLTVNGSTFSGNQANAAGAIQVGGGKLLLNDSSLVGNTARTGYGGAVDTYGGGGSVSVDHSTIAGNTAAKTGGAFYSYSPASVTDSTITGNTAANGAGIATKYGTSTVKGSTIAGNIVSPGGSGGQVWVENGPSSNGSVVLQDSIISGSGASPDVVLPSGTSGIASFSLIRNASAPSGDVPITQDATDVSGLDPQLGPLQFNGGPTETMVPLPTSPVLDRGNSEGLATDQRGLPRPFVLPTISFVPAGGDHADIGAAELETPAVGAIAPTSGNAGTSVGIVGTGFTGATQILFGSIPATSFTVLNDGAISAVAPIGAGTEDIRVITPLGESPVSAGDKFAFPAFSPAVSKPHAKRSGNKVNTGIKISCPVGGLGCAGSFKATAFIKHHKTQVAHGQISLSTGHSKTITFTLGSRAMKQLKRAGRLKLTIQITVADGSETPVRVNRTITLRYKHKKH